MSQRKMNNENKKIIEKINNLREELSKSKSIKGKTDEQFIAQHNLEIKVLEERINKKNREINYLRRKEKEELEKGIGEIILSNPDLIGDPEKLLNEKKKLENRIKNRRGKMIKTRQENIKKLQDDINNWKKRITERELRIERKMISESRNQRARRLLRVGANIESILQYINNDQGVPLDESRSFAQDLVATIKEVRDHEFEEIAKELWNDFFEQLRASKKRN